MSPEEERRIREAAVNRGRAERRSQGIPEEITDPVFTAQLARLLRRN